MIEGEYGTTVGETGPEEPVFSIVPRARLGEMDPVRELPYRLAALIIAASEAGQMAASDYRVRPIQNIACAKGDVHRWKADAWAVGS